MRMSDMIEDFIRQLISAEGMAEIQRNELAGRLGCVPSQINYVITSRFTPEQGYIVESRRGGGGYIRIRRVRFDRGQMLMHLVNSVGDAIDAETARVWIAPLAGDGIIGEEAARLMGAAVSEKVFSGEPPERRAALRACLLKPMMVALLR